MRVIDWLLLAGFVGFLAGAAVVLAGMGRADDRLMLVGVAGIVAGVASFGVAAWRLHTRVDWERVDAEQRLWESGPLGRAWLRLRQGLLGR